MTGIVDRAMTTVPEFEGLPGLETMIAGITHDVRAQLALIKLLAGRAAQSVADGDPSDAIDSLRWLDQVISKACELCEDAIECGRRRSERSSLVLETVDLALLVRECVELHSGLFEQSSCTIDVCAPDSAFVASHRRSTERILANLVRNAVQHGRGKPIELYVLAGTGSSTVVVRDHGAGIPQAALSRIFAPYERGEAEDCTHHHGYGLGLWIVRTLVASLGGELRVASEVGRGTAVSFTLSSR